MALDDNPFSLVGKKILVTGASSGIGKGVSLACAKMKATLVLNGRNEQRLEETRISLPGGGHIIISADLNDFQQIQEMVPSLPVLDGVVHCAGIGQRKLCRQLEEIDVDSILNTNFKAPVLLQTEILRQKKLNKGASIVFIASIASHSPSIGNSMYSASKGALVSYANCLQLELAPKQIRVNCISPAMVWTDLIMQGGITKEDLVEDEKKYPLKRYGTPEDIANLAIYMLSDASTWMTGSDVKISGGVN